MVFSVFDSVENMVGKGEKCLYKQFLLFPRFQKASFRDPSKGVIVWEWVNPFANHMYKTIKFKTSKTATSKFKPVTINSLIRYTCTSNPGVLSSSRTGSSGGFPGSVLRQDTSEPQPSTGETQERLE